MFALLVIMTEFWSHPTTLLVSVFQISRDCYFGPNKNREIAVTFFSLQRSLQLNKFDTEEYDNRLKLIDLLIFLPNTSAQLGKQQKRPLPHSQHPTRHTSCADPPRTPYPQQQEHSNATRNVVVSLCTSLQMSTGRNPSRDDRETNSRFFPHDL